MAINDAYTNATDGLGNGNDLIVDGSSSGTGAVTVTEMGGTGGCDIYREVDTANDGSWAVSVKMDTTSGQWHAQINQLLVSQSENIRLRINNTSGSSADVFATGFEVDD